MGELFANTLALALQAAPWLVLGLVVAGLIRAWLPARAIGARLGGSGLKPVSLAAALGAPLPLCSCGVLPAAFSLRRAGASRASTTSFLISTPETGVDSIALSYALLGPLYAVVRPVAALASAIATGLAVGRFAPERGGIVRVNPAELFEAEHAGHDHCCAQQAPARGRWARTVDGLRYAFTDLLDDIAVWLGVGLVLAGVVVTLVPPDALAAWGGGLFAMLLMLAVAAPMYVCASASTPIAHAMLHAGVSPGTVLVFLLAGPATNVAGVALVKRELGGRATGIYLTGVCVSAVALGLLLDLAWAGLGFALLSEAHAHDHTHDLPLWLSGPLLALVAAFALKPLRRLVLRPTVAHAHHH